MNFRQIVTAVLPFILMFGVFYLLLILPEKKRKKKYDATIDELRVNDRIIAKGGIIGGIVKLKNDSAIIEITQGRARIEFSKQDANSEID